LIKDPTALKARGYTTLWNTSIQNY